MITKMGGSGNLYWALVCNQLKIENENGQVLFANIHTVRQPYYSI